MWCTGIGGYGASRSVSIRRASRRKRKPRAIAAPYVPFGAGPRTCIGGSFAMLEGKTILATLLARARFALPDGETPTPFARITLRPKEGLKLNVTMLAD